MDFSCFLLIIYLRESIFLHLRCLLHLVMGKDLRSSRFAGRLFFIVVSILVLPLVMGVTGVWLSVPLAEFVTLFISVGYFKSQHKKIPLCIEKDGYPRLFLLCHIRTNDLIDKLSVCFSFYFRHQFFHDLCLFLLRSAHPDRER